VAVRVTPILPYPRCAFVPARQNVPLDAPPEVLHLGELPETIGVCELQSLLGRVEQHGHGLL